MCLLYNATLGPFSGNDLCKKIAIGAIDSGWLTKWIHLMTFDDLEQLHALLIASAHFLCNS